MNKILSEVSPARKVEASGKAVSGEHFGKNLIHYVKTTQTEAPAANEAGSLAYILAPIWPVTLLGEKRHRVRSNP